MVWGPSVQWMTAVHGQCWLLHSSVYLLYLIFSYLKTRWPSCVQFLESRKHKALPPFATWQCQTLEKYKLGQEWLFSWAYRPGKKSTQIKTFVFKIFWPCTEADNGECKLWGQDIWRGWPIAKLGKKGRRTCQDCQGERLVRTLYKARRTHIANEKDPHSKASSACNCDQAPGHTKMP